MWQSIDKLMGRGHLSVDTEITDTTATDFLQYFNKKVEEIRASTSDARAPDYVTTECVFHAFRPVSPDDVAEAVRKLPNKQCSTDPMATWLLKDCVSTTWLHT